MKCSLSQKNLDMLTQYCIGNTEQFEQKDEDYKNIVLSWMSDVNSSSVRELITLNYLKYEKLEKKHGADGFDPINQRYKEVKPRSIFEGKIASSGNFNDMTLNLIERKKDFDVICSLFFQNRLVYIVEFPFSRIEEKIKVPVNKATLGRRIVSTFTYKDYDCDDLRIHYYDRELVGSSKCLSKKHIEMLSRRSENGCSVA